MALNDNFVDRPDAGHRPASPTVITALVATVLNGKAVSIPLNGEEVARVRARYSVALRRRGFVLRTRREPKGKRLVGWVEAGQ